MYEDLQEKLMKVGREGGRERKGGMKIDQMLFRFTKGVGREGRVKRNDQKEGGREGKKDSGIYRHPSC